MKKTYVYLLVNRRDLTDRVIFSSKKTAEKFLDSFYPEDKADYYIEQYTLR